MSVDRNDYVHFLHEEVCANPEKVGSKAANLAKMLQNGFPVPAGFALSVKAFRDFCDFNAINGIGVAKAEVKNIINAIIEGEFPPELERDIDNAVIDAIDVASAGEFAVRSSALGEDGLTDSMAGQLQTFLYVERKQVKDRIKECWSGLLDQRVMSYRAAKNIDFALDMGVVIQKQIDPLYAGVLFTVDPRLQTADHLVLEWVEGIGEKLVSGQVTPERMYLHRKNPVVSDEVDYQLKRYLEQVIELSFKAEGLLGYPVDVEWCASEDGVFILQARPITVLTTLMNKSAVIFSNVNIGENYPQPLSPFTWSVVESFRSHYFRSLFKRIGLSKTSIDEAAPIIDNLVGVQAGMAYYNLSNWYEMMALFPFGHWFRKFLDHYIGQRIPLKYEQRTEKLCIFREKRLILLRLWFWLKLFACYTRLDRQVNDFEREFYGRRRPWRKESLKNLTVVELEIILLDVMDFIENEWGGGALADFSAMVFPGLLEFVASKWLKELPDTTSEMMVAQFLQGLTLKSTESLKLLWQIAGKFGPDSDIRELLLSGDYEELDRIIQSSNYVELAGVKDLTDSFMEQFGGRCYHELMITSPTFEERRDLFWDLVKGYLLSPDVNPFTQESAERSRREEFTRKCLKRIGFVKRPVFRKILKDAQSAVAFREKARLCQSLIYGELRRVVLELGERLAGKGYFEKRDDIFYLEFEELHRLLEGKFMYPETIPTLVKARKKAHSECSEFNAPEFFVVEKGDYLRVSENSAEPESKGKVFRGLGVSRGSIRGRIKVILNPTEQDRLAPGEILVTRTTDPGWTSLFLIAGGLILEKGGLLSHGAIVAREFGIPAVVGVKDITRLIKDGQLVNLNADTGEIKLLDDESGKEAEQGQGEAKQRRVEL